MLPHYIKPSMTVEDAARQAHMRGKILKASWDPTMGLRVVEVLKVTNHESERSRHIA